MMILGSGLLFGATLLFETIFVHIKF